MGGTSGLMLAAMAQQVGVVERLLEEDDIDVNRRGKNGETAITIAALQGNEECLSLLLRSGADVTSVNDSGKSALGLAADHAKMEDFLEIAGSLVIAGCRGTEKDWAILEEVAGVVGGVEDSQRKKYIKVPCPRSSDERIAYCKCSVEPRRENQSVGDSWEPA